MEINTGTKTLITMFASEKSGHQKIEYPIFHSLIFYLNATEKLRFPGYLFKPSTWIGHGDFLESYKLHDDINELVIQDALKIKYSFPSLELTKNGRELAKKVVPQLHNGESFDDLTKVVGSLLVGKDYLLSTAYDLYIETRYLKPKVKNKILLD